LDLPLTVITQGLHGLRGEQAFYVLEGELTVGVGPQKLYK
jgi:quercetin dioxygenase-like cupin family protein